MKRNEESQSKNKICAIWYWKQAWKAIQTNMTPALFQMEICRMEKKGTKKKNIPLSDGLKTDLFKWLSGSTLLYNIWFQVHAPSVICIV